MKTIEDRISEWLSGRPNGFAAWKDDRDFNLLREAAEELRRLRGALEEADSFAGRCICGEERRVQLRQRVREALRSKP